MSADDSTSSGAFVIIAAVVIFGMIAAFLFMRYMLNQSKVKMIEQANERHQRIKDIDSGVRDSELVHVKMKMKKGMDNVNEDSDQRRANQMNIVSDQDLGEYEE